MRHSVGEGLCSTEAARRLTEHGPYRLPEAERTAWWVRVGRQLQSPIIYILLFALAFDVIIWFIEGLQSWPIESLAILVILGFKTVMGVWQVDRAEDALARLQALAAPKGWYAGTAASFRFPRPSSCPVTWRALGQAIASRLALLSVLMVTTR